VPLSLPPKTAYRIGIISDTHGYLPPQVTEIFREADLILHAGDIGSSTVLEALGAIAPVVAVRGNMDWGVWAEGLPETDSVTIDGAEIRLIHDLLKLKRNPPPGHLLALVNGHTHRSQIERRNGVLYVNPGSAGAPRHRQEACVALLRVAGGKTSAELIPLSA
jgi:hypothetical protein